MKMDFSRFEALTFDCYGTLIDWERGILDALRPALSSGDALGEHGPSGAADLPGDGALLEFYAAVESSVQAGPYEPYRDVLLKVVKTLASKLDVDIGVQAAERFAASVVDWPPFADSPESLRTLAPRFRLAIVSNVDDDLFAGSARQLGVAFDEVVTAQQVRSYKPAHEHFHEVLRRLDLPMDRVLHVAQSIFHDIAPAKELGFTTVWVNRRAGKAGGGATAPATATPDFEVPDMRSLVELLSTDPA